MKIEEIDYQDIPDGQIDALVEKAQNSGDAAVLQRPIESAFREASADERGNWERPVSDRIDTAKENFRTLRDRLDDAGVAYTTVESTSTATSRNQLGQADEIEVIFIILSFIPLVVFLPIGYILNKLGKEELRRRTLQYLLLGMQNGSMRNLRRQHSAPSNRKAIP